MTKPREPKSEPWHGTAGGYTNHDCRGAKCTKAWKVYHKAYMNAKPERLAAAARREKARRAAK